MASKHKKGRNRSAQPRPVTSKPILDYSTALERARRALEQNQADSAKFYAEKALEFVSADRTSPAARVAQQFLAEAHFRQAAAAPLPQDQETHLNAALVLAPQEARFHFHRAVALFRQARLADVSAALDKAAGHPGVAFVGALLRLANGQTWEEKGLTPDEASSLRLLNAVRQNKPARSLHELAQQSMLASHEIWQALIDLRSDANSVTPEHLQKLAGPLVSSEAQGILHYYAGVAALGQGRKQEAAAAWGISAASGWSSPWLTENNEYLGREDVIALAQDEKWEEIVKLAERISGSVNDRILSETIGTAYFVLGYQAAEAANWGKAAGLLRAASKYVGGRTLSQNLALCEEALERWDAAGDAWREMARRRPRSENHPDYMTDAQVASIWVHAAECYDRSEYVNEEVLNCLRTAVKYAEDDIDVRTKLVDALLEADREEAAENELVRILEIDENHIPTLLRLAHIATEKWGGQPIPLFRRVLALEPDNQEARDSLADHYLRQTTPMRGPSQNLFGRLLGGEAFSRLLGMGEERPPIKLLKEALQDLPGHPRILLTLGLQYREAGKKKEASATLQEAYRVDPKHIETAGKVMHEMLHLKEFSVVEEMITEVRELPTLLMGFWVSQGAQVLTCKLGDSWAMRFFEESLLLADKKRGDNSRPSALVQIIDVTFENNASALTEVFLERVRNEMPESGILEYTEARIVFRETKDGKKAQRLLHKAKRMAEKMGDPALSKEMNDLEALFSGRRNPLMDILRDFGGDDVPDFF